MPDAAAIEASLVGAGHVEVDLGTTVANVQRLQASHLGPLPGGSMLVAPVAQALRAGVAIGKLKDAMQQLGDAMLLPSANRDERLMGIYRARKQT